MNLHLKKKFQSGGIFGFIFLQVWGMGESELEVDGQML